MHALSRAGLLGEALIENASLVGRTANVELTVPEEWNQQTDAVADLAAAVKASTRETEPCL